MVHGSSPEQPHFGVTTGRNDKRVGKNEDGQHTTAVTVAGSRDRMVGAVENPAIS